MIFPIAGMRDPEIFRKAVRRLTLLDDAERIETDHDLLDRAAGIVKEHFAGLLSAPQGPTRAETDRASGCRDELTPSPGSEVADFPLPSNLAQDDERRPWIAALPVFGRPGGHVVRVPGGSLPWQS
jgi:hypothetical protein